MDIEKTHRSRAGRIAVAALLLGVACPLAAAQTPAAGTSQSVIDADALRSAASDETVRAFYERNGWKPVWSESAAKALDMALADRAAHGLDRVSFDADGGSSGENNGSGNSSANGAGESSGKTADSPAAIEAARTGTALRYAAALARGVVDPASLHEVYTLARPETDLAAPLATAIAEGRLGAWFASLAPQDGDYAKLAEAYHAAAQAMPAEDAARDARIAASGLIRAGDSDERVPAIARQLAEQGYLSPDSGTTSGTSGSSSSSGSSGSSSGSGSSGSSGSSTSAASAPSSSTSSSAPPAADASQRYTDRIAEAVKRLQEEYGIASDGVVGPDTLEVLNLRPGDRARALAVALERRRWLARTPAATRIDVNVATSQLDYYRDGTLVDSRKVIVGAPDHATPLLLSPIYRLVANPTWTIPKSIENSEMANVSASELERRNMVRKDGYIVQQPGPDNALGLVKFDMLNDQAIYLHDTGSPSLFDRSQRHLSHGCVRVADALGFAKLLAEDQGIAEKWQQATDGSDTQFIDLPQHIPVRLLYRNAFVDGQGEVAVRTDPYGWNGPVAKALGFGEGSARRARVEPVDLTP